MKLKGSSENREGPHEQCGPQQGRQFSRQQKPKSGVAHMILLGQPPLPQGDYRGCLKIPPPSKCGLHVFKRSTSKSRKQPIDHNADRTPEANQYQRHHQNEDLNHGKTPQPLREIRTRNAEPTAAPKAWVSDYGPWFVGFKSAHNPSRSFEETP